MLATILKVLAYSAGGILLCLGITALILDRQLKAVARERQADEQDGAE